MMKFWLFHMPTQHETMNKKNIFIINGSASNNSSNERLIDNFVELTRDHLTCFVFNDLKTLPHFDPGLSVGYPPDEIVLLRERIAEADGVLICTPEYVFSIPSGLKNAIEWCVATTVFSNKPTGIITASASGEKGHEELQMIMKTVMADFTENTTLLIQGVKGKINEQGEITDSTTKQDLKNFVEAYKRLLGVGE